MFKYIVGDYLTVTNHIKITEAIKIGSISESTDAVKLSKQNGWGFMTSHRSGETEDSYIAEVLHVVESVLPSTISFLESRLSWMDGWMDGWDIT